MVEPGESGKTIRWRHAEYIHQRGSWSGGGGWASAAAGAVGDSGACAEAGAADGAEEGEDCTLERRGDSAMMATKSLWVIW